MKKATPFAALALAAAVALTAAGAPVPLTPVDEPGFDALLRAHRGKVVLVDFWATWCDPCREELPVLIKLGQRLRARGLVLITVSADEPEQESEATQLLEKTGAPRPAYVKRPRSDEDFINHIDRKWSGALPALFLYNREGQRVATFIGETPASEIEAAVSKLL